MKHKNTTVIGLDIGSYSIKCAEISRDNEHLRLEKAVVSVLPPAQSPNALTGILKNLFPEAAASSDKRFRISVSGTSFISRRIKLPLMTAAELKSAIRFQAETQLPFPIDDCMVDCQILTQKAADRSMEVLLVAVKRDFLEQRLKELAGAGIYPEVVDGDVFCMANAFEILGQETNEKTYGLLNIGHKLSSFVIVHEGILYFVREIPQEVADVKQSLESLSVELINSVNYFENETSVDLKSIWMSGGGALSGGAAAVLSESLGRQVSLWDNTQKMELGPAVDAAFLREHSTELNVAFGLALRR